MICHDDSFCWTPADRLQFLSQYFQHDAALLNSKKKSIDWNDSSDYQYYFLLQYQVNYLEKKKQDNHLVFAGDNAVKTEEDKQYDKIIKEYEKKEKESYYSLTSREKELFFRHKLLKYPQLSTKEQQDIHKKCMEQYPVYFNHTKRPVTLTNTNSTSSSSSTTSDDIDSKYPSKLPQAALDTKTLIQQHFTLYDINGFSNDMDIINEYLSQQKLDNLQIRTLLQRLTYPQDVNGNLIKYIVKLLKDEDYHCDFGSLNVHKLLTYEQLIQLSKEYSDVKYNNTYIQCVINRLQPNIPLSLLNDEEIKEYYKKMYTFAKDLSSNHNTILYKASIYYHYLTYEYTYNNDYDFDHFIKYIELPHASYPHTPPKKAQYYIYYNNLYNNIGLLPRVSQQDHNQLVERYINEWFSNDKNTNIKKFSSYLDEDWLKIRMAKAKIMKEQKNGKVHISTFCDNVILYAHTVIIVYCCYYCCVCLCYLIFTLCLQLMLNHYHLIMLYYPLMN